MCNQFLNNKYGEAWLRGFGLMMKGIKKYGIHIPFMPVGFTLFDYTRGSCGDIDAYSAANLEIWNMSFVDFSSIDF